MSEGMQHQLQQQEQRRRGADDDSKQQEFASGYLGKDDQKLQERERKIYQLQREFESRDYSVHPGEAPAAVIERISRDANAIHEEREKLDREREDIEAELAAKGIKPSNIVEGQQVAAPIPLHREYIREGEMGRSAHIAKADREAGDSGLGNLWNFGAGPKMKKSQDKLEGEPAPSMPSSIKMAPSSLEQRQREAQERERILSQETITGPWKWSKASITTGGEEPSSFKMNEAPPQKDLLRILHEQDEQAKLYPRAEVIGQWRGGRIESDASKPTIRTTSHGSSTAFTPSPEQLHKDAKSWTEYSHGSEDMPTGRKPFLRKQMDKVEDKWESAKNKVESKLESAKDKVSGKLESAKDKVEDGWEKAKDKVEDGWESTKEQVGEWKGETSSKMSELSGSIKTKGREAQLKMEEMADEAKRKMGDREKEMDKEKLESQRKAVEVSQKAKEQTGISTPSQAEVRPISEVDTSSSRRWSSGDRDNMGETPSELSAAIKTRLREAQLKMGEVAEDAKRMVVDREDDIHRSQLESQRKAVEVSQKAKEQVGGVNLPSEQVRPADTSSGIGIGERISEGASDLSAAIKVKGREAQLKVDEVAQQAKKAFMDEEQDMREKKREAQRKAEEVSQKAKQHVSSLRDSASERTDSLLRKADAVKEDVKEEVRDLGAKAKSKVSNAAEQTKSLFSNKKGDEMDPLAHAANRGKMDALDNETIDFKPSGRRAASQESGGFLSRLKSWWSPGVRERDVVVESSPEAVHIRRMTKWDQENATERFSAKSSGDKQLEKMRREAELTSAPGEKHTVLGDAKHHLSDAWQHLRESGGGQNVRYEWAELADTASSSEQGDISTSPRGPLSNSTMRAIESARPSPNSFSPSLSDVRPADSREPLSRSFASSGRYSSRRGFGMDPDQERRLIESQARDEWDLGPHPSRERRQFLHPDQPLYTPNQWRELMVETME